MKDKENKHSRMQEANPNVKNSASEECKQKEKIVSHHSNYTAKNTIKNTRPGEGSGWEAPIERRGKAMSHLLLEILHKKDASEKFKTYIFLIASNKTVLTGNECHLPIMLKMTHFTSNTNLEALLCFLLNIV